jgi:hypothetical protein
MLISILNPVFTFLEQLWSSVIGFIYFMFYTFPLIIVHMISPMPPILVNILVPAVGIVVCVVILKIVHIVRDAII